MPEHKPAVSEQPQIQDLDTNVLSNSNPYDEGKVYCSDGIRYEAMLNFVDISTNKNTYFKLKLTSNDGKGYE